MKKLGLALGGGGMRGVAHIGVLQVLCENKIRINSISGTSAGSIFAVLYACGVSPWEMERIALNISPRDYLDYNWRGLFQHAISKPFPGKGIPFEGFIKGNRLEKLIMTLTRGKRLNDCHIPLSVVACDINSGNKVIFSNRKITLTSHSDVILKQDAYLYEAVRASCSIPAVFVPFDYEGLQLVDGGVSEMVPVMEQRDLGADYILAVNLGPIKYDTEVRGIIPVVSRSLTILEYGTSELAEDLFAQMVIFPASGDVALDDVSQVKPLIRSGRRAMKSQIDQLIRDLEL